MGFTVRPDPFHLVKFDAEVVRTVLEDVAAQVDFPPQTDVVLTVDEAIPHPIADRLVDVDPATGAVQLWCTGGCFEARDAPRSFSERHARAEMTVMLLRARDRLVGGFGAAPPEAGLTFAERAAWDTYAWGRAAALGHPIHEQKRRYDFRLQHGFTDAADAAFERLWTSRSTTWEAIREVCAETGAAQRPAAKTPIDVLRVTP